MALVDTEQKVRIAGDKVSSKNSLKDEGWNHQVPLP